jgi:hypothetical protein
MDLKRFACRMMVPTIGALALWGAAPAVAVETPQWYEFVEGGKSPITSNKEIKWTNGKITLNYNLQGIIDEVSCKDTGSGVVKPKGAGEITKWTISSCVTERGSCSSPGLVAERLPWTTELSYVSGKIVNLIKGTRPEFRLQCGGKPFFDECPLVKYPTMTNVEKGVSESFPGGELSCLNGGMAYVEGFRTLELTNGHVLSVK